MSYDIAVYDKDFLKKAIAEDLGDWTNAPEIPIAARESLEKQLKELGYKLEFKSATCRE